MICHAKVFHDVCTRNISQYQRSEHFVYDVRNATVMARFRSVFGLIVFLCSSYFLQKARRGESKHVMIERPQKDFVRHIARCDLRVGDSRWAYAEAHADSIELGWIDAKRTTPAYFNGVIHLLDSYEDQGDAISARLLRTDFKSYLCWRLSGWPDAGVLDGFGSALLRSADGDVILGKQRVGHVNGGLTYLPGGFIDARDVRGDGSIDLDASVRRELLEETGIGSDTVSADAGYYLTETGPHVSIAVPFRSHLSTRDLTERIKDHIRTDPDPELADVVIVRRLSDLDRLPMAHYARVLLTSLLPSN